MSDIINPADYELVAKMLLRRIGTTKAKLSKITTAEKSFIDIDYIWYFKRVDNQIFVSMSRKYDPYKEDPPKKTLIYTHKL